MKKRILFLILAIATGLLLHFAWPTTGFTPLIFIAFLPLLFVVHTIRLRAKKRAAFAVFGYSWIAFALFNLTTTLWVKNAHIIGPIATTIINGALMALPFLAYHFIAKTLSHKRAMLGLPFLWICIEVLHQDWDMSFPWLDLGNAFATHTTWIQWYDTLGHMGGTLWVWVVNLLLFTALLAGKQHKIAAAKYTVFALIFIAVPIWYSVGVYNAYSEKGTPTDVVVVQPNIEAFSEKFTTPESQQTNKFIGLAKSKLDSNVDFLVGPETLLGYGFNEEYPERSPSISAFEALAKSYPNLNLVFGATTFRVFSEKEKTPISLPFKNKNLWYEVYNTSYLLNRTGISEPYHKSKLVVAAEMMPFRAVLQPLLGKIIVDLGGMTGTHGTQDFRTVFAASDTALKPATIICWENEFGEYCTDYVKNGANILFHITNDGWWGNSDGHRQHMHYARLRAIENRRAIARSANTGISCFINQRGDVSQPQPWATNAAIRQTIYANNQLSFYTKNGDLVGRISLFISAFLMLIAFSQRFVLRGKTTRTLR